MSQEDLELIKIRKFWGDVAGKMGDSEDPIDDPFDGLIEGVSDPIHFCKRLLREIPEWKCLIMISLLRDKCIRRGLFTAEQFDAEIFNKDAERWYLDKFRDQIPTEILGQIDY